MRSPSGDTKILHVALGTGKMPVLRHFTETFSALTFAAPGRCKNVTLDTDMCAGETP